MSEVATNTTGLVGEIIGDGRYDLRELLGGGSMGHVYRALDRRLENHVVIKIPKKNRIEKADFLKRFKQESRFLVKLSHPNVVSIIDVGEYDGLPFFVMPFVGGGSLRDRQRNEFGVQKPLPPASLQSWLLDIARALDFIHSQGCIHRDVKPDNILFDEHGHALLSDFGLSKILDAADTEDVAQTAAGAIVGTPLYVAPEIVLGDPFDGRADQYSLALMVYETLAGSNPFEGKSSSATMVNQTSMVAPQLDEVSARISPLVARLVSRGLEKAPGRRFASCTDFAEEVLAAIHGEPPRTATPSPSAKARAARSSSESNALTDTSPDTPVPKPRVAAQAMPAAVPKTKSSPSTPAIPARPAANASARSQMSAISAAPKLRFIAKARTPIVKAKANCPACSKPFVLQPSFAGRRAACKGCGTRLLISADFSELVQLEIVQVRDTATQPADGTVVGSPSASDATSREPELILGQEIFGWRLNRKVAAGLVVVLVGFLVGMAVFFTNKAAEQREERMRREFAPRSTEGG